MIRLLSARPLRSSCVHSDAGAAFSSFQRGHIVALADCPHPGHGLAQIVPIQFITELAGTVGGDGCRERVRLERNLAGQNPADFLGLPVSRISQDRKSTRLNSSHTVISYAVFC